MILPHPLTPRLPAPHLMLKLPILTTLQLLLHLDLNTLPFLHFSITGSGAHRIQQRWQAQICSQGSARRTLGQRHSKSGALISSCQSLLMCEGLPQLGPDYKVLGHALRVMHSSIIASYMGLSACLPVDKYTSQ